MNLFKSMFQKIYGETSSTTNTLKKQLSNDLKNKNINKSYNYNYNHNFRKDNDINKKSDKNCNGILSLQNNKFYCNDLNNLEYSIIRLLEKEPHNGIILHARKNIKFNVKYIKINFVFNGKQLFKLLYYFSQKKWMVIQYKNKNKPYYLISKEQIALNVKNLALENKCDTVVMCCRIETDMIRPEITMYNPLTIIDNNSTLRSDNCVWNFNDINDLFFYNLYHIKTV